MGQQATHGAFPVFRGKRPKAARVTGHPAKRLQSESRGLGEPGHHGLPARQPNTPSTGSPEPQESGTSAARDKRSQLCC